MDTLTGERTSLGQNDGSLETAEPLAADNDLQSFQKEFVTHTSYEMRSMLNAITGFGDLLRDKAIMPEHRDYGDEIYDTLEQLRFVVKYILFDLEATRRENESLRKILDEYRGR